MVFAESTLLAYQLDSEYLSVAAVADFAAVAAAVAAVVAVVAVVPLEPEPAPV